MTRMKELERILKQHDTPYALEQLQTLFSNNTNSDTETDTETETDTDDDDDDLDLFLVQTDRLGQCPLHWAGAYGASHEILSFLFSRCRQAVLIQDHYGSTPFHLIMQQPLPHHRPQMRGTRSGTTTPPSPPTTTPPIPRVITEMIEQYPQLLTMTNCLYRTPLHAVLSAAAASSFPASAAPSIILKIQFLMAHTPSSVFLQRDDQMRTPLYWACTTKEWLFSQIPALVERCPQAVGQCLSGRSTHVPLHALMLCGKEADVKEMYPAVEAMVTACPQAFGYRNGKKNTPLHLLCCAMPNLAPLLALAVQHCPQAFAQVDAIGKNPLHVLFSQSSVGGMGGTHSSILPHLQALFDNHTTSTFLPKGGGPARELLRKVDRNHNTPIHYLCQPRTRMTGRWSSFSSSFSHDLVTYLVAQCPQALAVKNQDGNTPLHLACSHPLLEIRLLAYMSEQYPSATLLLNRDGKCVSCLVKEPQASFDRIVAAMHQAVSVVVSLVYATPSWCYVPPKVKHHVMSAVTWPPNGPTSMLSTGSLSWSELVQLNFSGPDGQRALEEFLVNDDLQNYLKTESMQGFVCGMIRMNESGRAYLKADSGSKVCGLTVLESVSYNVDSLFFHLRENPDLCNRDP